MSLFSQVEVTRPRLNKFNLSHSKDLTIPFDSGQITPVYCEEIIPGDRLRVNNGMLARFAPQLAPWYGEVDAFVRYYFVPYRLIWTESEDFFTGGTTGLVAPVLPYITMNNANKAYFAESSLADYLGLPSIAGATTVVNNQNVNALPFRAYQLCYNEWFLNQNLVTEVPFVKTSGDSNADIANIATIRKCMWEKDYFTSALPSLQRGNPVALPIDSQVTYKPVTTIRRSDTGANPDNGPVLSTAGNAEVNSTVNPDTVRFENIQSISSTSFTINDLRLAEALQKWAELSMRVGSRYVEHLKGFFNVSSPDARLQRPEFLGGTKTPLIVSEVVSTFQDATSSAQGNLAGHGIMRGGGKGVEKRFTEHGLVLGLMYIRPRTKYMQGIPRMFSKTTKYDFFYDQLSHLGEQSVLNKELFYSPTGTDTNNGTFGYQSRYCEYKYATNTIHGAFRSSLAYWTPARIFSSQPNLNSAFVTADPSNRIFAVTAAGTQNVWITLYNKVDALRPMPYYGTPGLS